MSTFRDALAKFGVLAQERVHDAFIASTEEVQRSVIEGSEVTGAPGQPVDTGALARSWQPEFVNPALWRITATGVDPQTGEKVGYAEHVEDNVRGVTFRNHGPHSVRLTRAGWDRIVEKVAREAATGTPPVR